MKEVAHLCASSETKLRSPVDEASPMVCNDDGGLCIDQHGHGLGAAPTVEQSLKLTPTQEDVDVDSPKPSEIESCTIKAEKIGAGSGWMVRDPFGQLLRRFVDSNSDNFVDLWCYYKNGIEVYRDIDSDFNGKAEQFRWLHTAGTRWGLDNDADGKIDHWKTISAEEVSAEVIQALAQRDSKRFQALLLTDKELATLGLESTKVKELTLSCKRPPPISLRWRNVRKRSTQKPSGCTSAPFDPASCPADSMAAPKIWKSTKTPWR